MVETSIEKGSRSPKDEKEGVEKKVESKLENKLENKLDRKLEKKSKPSWVKMKQEELVKLVLELNNKGLSPTRIGQTLRDEHGVPKSKIMGKRIGEILRENNIEHKGDKEVVGEKIERLKKHIEKNKHDYTSSRSLTKSLWALKRLN